MRYFESSLEKAGIDEALDPSKIPNISMVQKPSPPLRILGKKKKPVLALAGGGLALGLGLAFLIELVLDRRVRRSVELETKMQMPLFLSIPLISHRTQLRLNNRNDSGSQERGVASAEVVPWDGSHFIRPFADSIRDRLILWFQLKKLTHKPKLVGITGVAGGEGASTLAASLATSLSKTGDGKVLLVDLNSSRSDVNSFSNGKPEFGLLEALEANGNMQPASENLYLASGVSLNDRPKQFYDMIPSFQASQFDYIIFDLPPASRRSITLALSGGLDKLLLVVEAEKSNRDLVKRTYTELANARADVSAILNKTRESLIS